MRALNYLIILASLSLSLSSCAVLGAASKFESVISSQEDPQLVAEALPSYMLAAEALSEADPGDPAKAATTGSLCIMYGSAFVQDPASNLPDERFEERKAAFDRAAVFYHKGFGILSDALNRGHPGLVDSVATGGDKASQAALSQLGKADVPLLYWCSASILAAFSMNPLDFQSAHYLAAAPRFLLRAADLDPAWNHGSIFSLLMAYYAGMPDYLGGDMAKALGYYDRARAYSGDSASLQLSYARSICLPKGDEAGFKAALAKVLAVDLKTAGDSRLETVLAQRSARLLLAKESELFDNQ